MRTYHSLSPSDPLRICLWSGPRSVSTALMYSFAQRHDTRALDEPLYGHYLRTTGAQYPGRDHVLASTENDGSRVVHEVILGPCDRPLLFMKHMAHHLIGLDRCFPRQTVNVLLVRDPALVLASLARKLPTIQMEDTGFESLSELRQQLRAWGQEPPVLDAGYLLLDPPGVLNALCDAVGIPFDAAMLSWKAGKHPEDGVWAPYWYHNVQLSTGFQRHQETLEPLPEELLPLLEECRSHYEPLKADAIRTDPARLR
jgi:Sulfotransferase domain